MGVEEAQGTEGLVEQAPGDLGFEQVELEGLDVVGAEEVRGAVGEAAEAGDVGDVGLDGTRGAVAQPQLVDESLPQRGHGSFSAGTGTGAARRMPNVSESASRKNGHRPDPSAKRISSTTVYATGADRIIRASVA